MPTKKNTAVIAAGYLVKSSKYFLLALLSAKCLVNSRVAVAQVTSANSSTTVYNSANGVPVVDIANPNGAGLSHNLFLNYNVERNGLVLNNGDSSQILRQSQLAGAVAANLHLQSAAGIILNEVVTTNRSTLAGYTEVLGKSADVVVANPNGITCKGCGFINTPNVTLTTGAPVIGATGVLQGFSVNNGDILVSENGLNGTKQDHLALIARSLRLEAQINAKALDIVAGANDVDYATLAATPHAASDPAPLLAIDSAALGGMYADRIRLVATEAGVGVRMLGDAAAGVGDFTLDAAGKIEVDSHLSAKGDLRLASTASGADAILENGASLTSQGDMTLTADNGNIHLLGGALTARGNMTARSASLTDVFSADILTDNNKRYAVGTLTLEQIGIATFSGTSYGAGGVLSMAADTLSIGPGGETLYGNTLNIDTNGDLSLAGAALQSQHDLTLRSETGMISTSAGNGQGIVSVAGDMTLTAGGGMVNAGAISAGGALLVLADGAIANSGAIYAANTATFTDKNGGQTEDIDNSGTLVADVDLVVKGASLTNSGNLQGTDGSTFTLATLTNSGKFIASANGAKSGTIHADTLNNVVGGTLQSAGDLNLFVTNTLTDGNGVKIIAGRDLTMDVGSLVLGDADSAIIAAQSGSGTGVITIGSVFANPGLLFSGGDLTVNAPSIINSQTGGIAAVGTLHANATAGGFYNFGALYAGALLDAQATTTFTNEAVGTVDGGQDITIAAQTFINSHYVHAGRNLSIDALYFYNEVPGGDQRSWWTGSATTTHTGWDSNPDYLFWGEHAYDYYTKTWQVHQYYVYSPPATKPELVGGTALNISGFHTALNLGGVISAPTVTISSAQPGASFTNDDYGLTTQYYTETWYKEGHWGGWGFTWVTSDYNNDIISHADTSTTYGGGIYTNTLTATGFGLTQISSLYTASITPTNGSGSLESITVNDIAITLPANPNGYFILAKDPKSKYLIETNPLYSVDSAFLGSGYMLKRFGVDPDTLERRLGDANYEASLIRQQLLNAGAAALLNVADEATAMQKLMESGADQGKALGLTVGVAPTPAQLAGLNSDFVWMVDTVVAGEHVLAPVVYLSEATRSQIVSGAVIMASNADLDLTSLSNTGGTISGSNTLNITTQGDISNTSGTIKGGNVALSSTEGNIVNQTAAETTGGAGNQHTNIGKTAGIEATGNLSLDAKNDITNKGANMSAGGDASLKAGKNITFDTVEDKESSQAHSGSSGMLSSGTATSSTSSSTTNLKSGLTVGGNLKTESGQDTTLAGTDVNVGGNAEVKAGGDLNVIARNDSTETSTSSKSGSIFSGTTTTTSDRETTNVASNFNVGGNLNSASKGDTTIQGSNVNVVGNGSVSAGGDLNILAGQNTSDTASTTTHSGLGVGGGIYGVQGTTDTNQKSANVASNVKFGGNSAFTAGNDLTVQGSNVATGGNMEIKAQEVKVLEGRDNETSTHSETTTTFGKLSDSSASSSSASQAGASAGSGNKAANAKAEASANADASASGGVTLMETSTSSTMRDQSHAVGSNLSSGGNLNIDAAKDVTVRGSKVGAGGDANISAENVNILAAKNIDVTSNTSSNVKIGLYGDSANHAGASADAKAEAAASGTGSPAASASANAKAEAKSDSTLDVMRTNTKTDTTVDITHTGSSIQSGGKMNVKAQNDLKVTGSALDSGGDMALDAKNMSFTAATDSHTETKTDTATKAGLYLSGDASASAQANANAQGISGGAGASAEAEANAGVGLYGSNTTTGSVEGSTTAQTSSLHSGGDMTRNATNKISDEGTQIDAGGNFSQSSTTWESRAAQNTTFSSSSSETNTAKLGLYAKAEASASAEAKTTSGAKTDADANASAGLEAAYSRNTDEKSASASKAVVSNIQAGGKMTTTTTGKTALEGTNLNSGGDLTLNAGSLDYKAAQDTTSASSKTSKIDADVKVGVSATKAVDLGVSGGYKQDEKSSSTTTAVVGNMKSGGNLQVNTGGDAKFEGTNLSAQGDAGVKAGGDVNFAAAKNTATSSDTNFNASGSLSLSKSKGTDSGKGGTGAGVELEGGYGTSSSNKSDAVVGSISSGKNLTVTSGKTATFEGANLNSGGDTLVSAKDDVNFNAAQSSSSSSGWDVSGKASLSAGGTEKGKDGKEKEKDTKGSLGLKGDYSKENETTSAASSINSGGKVTVKSGNDVNLVGTNIASQGSTTLDAGHDVNFKAATNTSDKLKVSGGIDLSGSKPADGGKDAGKKAASPAPSDSKTAQDDKDKNKTKEKLTLDVSGGTSTTKTGGSINAGSIEIKSGHDTTLEGTKTESKGDTSINAGGDVKLAAAESTHLEGGIGGAIGNKGGGLTKASIDGGVANQVVDMKSGGDTNIVSGGKTVMEGTTINADGKAKIDAQGGLEKNSVVSGGSDLGLDHAGVDLKTKETEINAKGIVTPQASKPLAQVRLEKEFDQIKNNPNLSREQKVKLMQDKIKNDPDLTGAQKDKMLADLAAQQKQ